MKKFAMTAALAAAFIASPLAFAEKGHDMAGNEVELPANFTYGGDNTGAYAGGKIGTGVKDPAVCGTFSNEKCSITYTKGK
ncbi:MAG: hypothetical protein U1F34_03485 [Gammaproteobacteria bacterium]